MTSRHWGRGGGDEGFCDKSTKASVIKSVAMGEEIIKCLKLHDVINGRPLNVTIRVPFEGVQRRPRKV